MKSATLYRIAAVVMVLFAAGHTYGFLTLQPPTPEALAVRQGMMNVRFRIDNGDFSYGGFYVGFGLSITAWMPKPERPNIILAGLFLKKLRRLKTAGGFACRTTFSQPYSACPGH